MRDAGAFIAFRRHKLDVKPDNAARIQLRPYATHARNRRFVQKGVITAVFAAEPPA
jgi:hypothetical protein